MQHDVERRRLERTIRDDRTELRRALRDLAISALLGLNLPRRIRRRPVPWAIAAVGVTAFVIARRRRRLREEAHTPRWWRRGGAQA